MLYKLSTDTIRVVAQMRHFFTAEIELTEYGRVMLVGDQEAVERLIAMLASQDGQFKLLPPEA